MFRERCTFRETECDFTNARVKELKSYLKCEEGAGRYGDRFKPAPLLLEMAKKGETFYTRFAPPAGKRAA